MNQVMTLDDYEYGDYDDIPEGGNIPLLMPDDIDFAEYDAFDMGMVRQVAMGATPGLLVASALALGGEKLTTPTMLYLLGASAVGGFLLSR